MTVIDRDMLKKNLATLERIGEAVGEWTDKIEARQTGYSLHIKFENRVDVNLAAEHATVMQSCPAMLADALRRLIQLTEDQADGLA